MVRRESLDKHYETDLGPGTVYDKEEWVCEKEEETDLFGVTNRYRVTPMRREIFGKSLGLVGGVSELISE